MRAIVIDAHGFVWEVILFPGKALILKVPSSGFYAMTGVGSGARITPYDDTESATELGWTHEPMAGPAASVGLVVDHYATLADQLQQMRAACGVMVRRMRGKHFSPTTMPLMRESINFATTVLDQSTGVVISLNHYWKLVGEGKVVHRLGVSEENMQSIANGFAGTRPRPRPRPLLLCSSRPHLCCIRTQVVSGVVSTPRISRARPTPLSPSGR